MKKIITFLTLITMILSFSVIANAEGDAAALPSNVVVKAYDGVTLYSFLSDSVSPVIVETADNLVLIDYPGDSEEQAAAYVAFVERLGKPIERMIISHVDAAHWVNIEKYLPEVPLYSVDAAEIMALPEAEALTIAALKDDEEMSIEGIQYEFVTNREIGAWEIRFPELKAVYVEHLGYVKLHVLLAPLAPRAEMLKELDTAGYTYFMPGHGLPADGAEFVNQVEAYYTDIMAAVESNADAVDAIAEIAEKYPEYNTQGMLESMLPGLYE